MAALVGEKEGDEERRALRESVFEYERHKTETLTQFVERRARQFAAVERHGIVLPSKLKGMLMEEGSALPETGMLSLRSMTQAPLE
eukprot:3048744-Pyramimonas_sp.AAC.1